MGLRRVDRLDGIGTHRTPSPDQRVVVVDPLGAVGAAAWHLASISADALCNRAENLGLSSRAIRFFRWAARLVWPAFSARASRAVNPGSSAAMRASPFSIRVSTLVARAQLNCR